MHDLSGETILTVTEYKVIIKFYAHRVQNCLSHLNGHRPNIYQDDHLEN